MSEDVDQPHAAALTGHDPKHPANKTFRWRRSFWDYLQERRQRQRGLSLEFPRQVDEVPGQGIEGRVGNRIVAVGSPGWLERRGVRTEKVKALFEDDASGRAKVLVGVDGRPVGAIIMGDHLREDAPELVERLHAAEVQRVAMRLGSQT